MEFPSEEQTEQFNEQAAEFELVDAEMDIELALEDIDSDSPALYTRVYEILEAIHSGHL